MTYRIEAKSRDVDSLSSHERPVRRFVYTRAFWDTNTDSAVPATRESLGGKGLSLWEMTQFGIPVPPGFTISTSAGKDFLVHKAVPLEVTQEILKQLPLLEEKTGRRLGDPEHPLFVSARSGAEISMPGAMKTIINIGLNDQTVHPLAEEIGTKAAWVSYYHFVKQFATDVYHVDMSTIETFKNNTKALLHVEHINQLPLLFLQGLVEITKLRMKDICEEFPQDPQVQLKRAIHEVFASWNSPEAVVYRRQFGIAGDLGTAVTIQKMVWGNSEGEGSGSGVILTRDPKMLGEPVIGFLAHTQGTAAVGDTPHQQMPIDDLPVSAKIKTEIRRMINILESHHGIPRDVEFTIETLLNGQTSLYFLQDRKEPLLNPAYVRLLFEKIEQGIITEADAMRLATHRILYSILQPDLDPAAMEEARRNGNLIAVGQPISEGYATGPVCLSLKDASLYLDRQVILVTNTLNQVDLVTLPPQVIGLATRRGGIASHIGRIAARISIPVIFDIKFDEPPKTNEVVTLNGTTGELLRGIIPVAQNMGSSLLSEIQLAMARRWDLERERNPWKLLVSPTNESTIDQIGKTIAEALTTHKNLQSQKAKIEVAFATAIPTEIRMQYKVKQLDDIDGIKRRVREILESGYDATLRTGHYPDLPGGRGPWVNLQTPEAVDEFFTNSQYPSKYGGFEVWRENPTLTEIIIGQVPKDKLSVDPTIKKQHCVWTVSCTPDNELIIQIHPHSPHLRDLDEENADTFITYTLTVDIQKDSLSEQGIPEIGERLIGDTLALAQAQLVYNTIRDWYARYQLPERLAALATIFKYEEKYAPPALQGQARVYPDGSTWILAYDLNLDHFGDNIRK